MSYGVGVGVSRRKARAYLRRHEVLSRREANDILNRAEMFGRSSSEYYYVSAFAGFTGTLFFFKDR